MTKDKQPIPSSELVQLIVAGMKEKKAKDVVILDLRHISKSIADYFVIATGNVDTHVDAIQNSVKKTVHENHQEHPWHVEGTENSQWVLLDYVDVVAHIFMESKRSFYQLEDLWGDAHIIRVPENKAVALA